MIYSVHYLQKGGIHGLEITKLKSQNSTPIKSDPQITGHKGGSSSTPTTMAQLMASVKSTVNTFHKGDIVKGKVTKITPQEVLVEIGAKSEALVLEKDKKLLRNLLSTLKLGDTVEAQILSPESEMGYPVVSLRRFLGAITWDKLEELQKDHTEIEVVVDEITRGGYLVSTKYGVSGFLPNSQTSFVEAPQELVGQKINVSVLEINKQSNKIILSQKPVVSVEQFREKIKGITHGKTVKGVVSSITPFGVFVTLPTQSGELVDGLIHISEVAWEKVINLDEFFQVGKEIEATVIGVDNEAKRIDLSVKRLSKDPFEEKTKDIKVDQEIKGTIIRLGSTGISVSFPDGLEGFVRKEKIAPGTEYVVGDSADFTVQEINTRRRRLMLVPLLKAKPIGYR